MNLPFISSILARFRVPTGKHTVGTSLGEPAYQAAHLTADKIHAALRNAEAGECQDLFAIYRDFILAHSHIQTEFAKRKLAPLNKALTFAPADPKNKDDLRAAEACKQLARTPGWLQTGMNHLLNGHLYPVAVLEQCYQKAPVNNPYGLRYIPREFAIVPYHLLDWTDGRLMIWHADPNTGHRLGTKFDPATRGPRYIVHRGHLLTHIPDNWGGPLRAALFWFLFATQDRDWWVRFLDRFGAPFLVAQYEDGDTKSKNSLVAAFSAATRLFGLVVNKETEIKVHTVQSQSHGEAFKTFHEFANDELSKLILGQTMTTTAKGGALGSSQAQVQMTVLEDINAFDLTALAQTVNSHIIQPFLEFNGLPGQAELQVATDTGADLATKAEGLKAATAAGLEPTDEGIQQYSESLGIPLQRKAAPSAGAPGQDFNGIPIQELLQLHALTRGSQPFSGTNAEAILKAHGHPTDHQLDRIAQLGAPNLAEAFTGRYRKILPLLRDSESPEDFAAKAQAHFSNLPPGRVSEEIEYALLAYHATAAAQTR
jgi:phage gp29-like protein